MRSLFANLRTLVLPAGATTPPRIVLDGDNAQILVISATGAQIILNPNATNPEIDFVSADGLNTTKISQDTTTPSVVKLLIGPATIVDFGTANLQTAGDLNAIVAGSTETWHAMTLQNGWTDYGGTEAPSSYRLVPSPANCVQVHVAMRSGTVANGTVIATLPAGYRPAHVTHHAITTSVNGTRSPQLALDTAGNLSIFGIGTAGDVVGHALFPLDL